MKKIIDSDIKRVGNNKGEHFSEEWKEKLSQSHKGQVAWNKGKELSDEHKKHLSDSHKGNISGMKGKHHTEESKAKMSAKLKGRKLSKDTKIKLSESLKGHEVTEETRRKISEANKGKVRSEETKKKIGIASKNRKISESTKLKMSIRMKEFMNSEEGLKKVLRRRIPTSLEEKFEEIVNKNDLPYRFVGDGSFIIGGKNPDFINTNGQKIAIEVYARYFKLRNNKTIDEWIEERSKMFESFGWKIIFFNEIEVNERFILEKIKR